MTVQQPTFFSPVIVVLLSLCAVWGADVALPPAVQAHPHAFIVQRLTVLFDQKGMAGIRVRWKFDDMFASMIADDHDRDRNGTLDADEVKAIQKGAFEQISQYHYFVFIKIDGAPFDVRFVKDFNAVLVNRRLTYEFTVPCHVTATTQPKKITVGCYDPTYYTAIFFAKNNPVSLVANDAFEVRTAIREDPETAIYFDMIHPWTLFLEFRVKV